MPSTNNSSYDNRDEDPTGAFGLADIEMPSGTNGSLSVPEYRVPNANAAATIYRRMRDSHAKRARSFARIQGMVDGNPPYPRGKPERSNFNPRDAEALFEQNALAYWSLSDDVEHLVEVETDFAEQPAQNEDLAQIVVEEMTRLFRNWPKFQEIMTAHQGDMILFGMNSLVWIDEDDWHFDTIDAFSFLVPQQSRNSIEDLTLAAVEHTMTASELYDIYKNSTGGKWNKQAIEDILVFRANSHAGPNAQLYGGQEWKETQTRIRNGDIHLEDSYNEDILMVTLYVREFSGKISRGLFHPDMPHEALQSWPFFFHNQYEEMSHALQVATFRPGGRYMHGNKGLGHKMFNIIEATTRLDNNLMDGAARASTVLVRTRTGRNKDVKPIVFDHGGYVDIGEAEFIQNLMGSNLSSNVDVARYFRSKFEFNNNIAGTNPGTPDGKVRSAQEVRTQVTKEAKVQKNQIAHYYKFLDGLYAECGRKIFACKPGHKRYKEVKEFKDRCIKKGVPEDFFTLTKANTAINGLPSHLQIRAARVSGSGSQMADQIESQSMMNILPTSGQRGRVNILKDYVAAHRGWRYINRYLPPEDQSNEPVADDTLASIENNQLEKGEMVVVSPDNKHAVHAPRHLQRLKQLAQSFDEATNAARDAASERPLVDAGQFGQYGLSEVDIAFQTIGPHFVRHLLYLGQDPTQKDLASSLQSQWAQLANYGDMIANNAQEARQKELRENRKVEEQIAAMPSEERVAMAKQEVDTRLKTAKLLADIKRAATRDQLEYLVQRQRVTFENELKKSQTINKMAIDAAKEMKSASESTVGREEGSRF